jgi:hypothetical protein
MLNQLQQLRQYGCGNACADTREDYRQPEACRAGTRKGRGYHLGNRSQEF